MNQRVRVVDNFSTAPIAEYLEYFPDAHLSHNRNRPREHLHKLIEGDVEDSELAIRAAADVDIIVHLAANTVDGIHFASKFKRKYNEIESKNLSKDTKNNIFRTFFSKKNKIF